jgi:hypothetical protein
LETYLFFLTLRQNWKFFKNPAWVAANFVNRSSWGVGSLVNHEENSGGRLAGWFGQIAAAAGRPITLNFEP